MLGRINDALSAFEANMFKYTLTATSYKQAAVVFSVVSVSMCAFTWVAFGVKKNSRRGNSSTSDSALLTPRSDSGSSGTGGPPGMLEEVVSRRANKDKKSSSKYEYAVVWSNSGDSVDSKKTAAAAAAAAAAAKKSWHTKQELVDWGFQKIVDLKDEELVAMRRLSWILSCLNSCALTGIGAVYAYYKLKHSNYTLGYHDLHGKDNVSQLVALWFAMFNLTDLVFGTLVYPEQMDPITAYVHHPLFIYIMYAASTGNYALSLASLQPLSFTVLQSPNFTPTFVLMCVEELPTFILGLGTVYPALRLDAGFGASFFALRIVFHGYVATRGYFSSVHPIVSVLFSLTMGMHVFWFNGWVKGYLKQMRKGSSSSDTKMKKVE